MPMHIQSTTTIVVHSAVSKQITLKKEKQWTARNKVV